MNALTEVDYQTAPCLKTGPLAHAGERFILAAREMGENSVSCYLKSWAVAAIVGQLESTFSIEEDPTSSLNNIIEKMAGLFINAKSSNIVNCGIPLSQDGLVASISQFTAQHYGSLFRAFDQDSFWEEPAKLLSERLRRNGFDPSLTTRDKSVLDAGCGGGRYSAAWKAIGAKSVVGVDLSEIGVHDAIERTMKGGLTGIRFEVQDVLNLTFIDNTFDIVFSNGVLHHTPDWRKGVKELLRVLKPNGLGWLYLIENPGGLFWDTIEILRVLMRGTNLELDRKALYSVGIPASRVYYLLDHVMVPINQRLCPSEIEDCLKAAGAKDTQRFLRGVDFDRVESIHRKDPYASIKYGVGENRYVFTKE